ncbi:MAG: hypothetical protein LBU25_07610 [Treponema sp.]|nr:hypothetical protein [Treponema sp.]
MPLPRAPGQRDMLSTGRLVWRKKRKDTRIREMAGKTRCIIRKQVGPGPLGELRETFQGIEGKRSEPYREHLCGIWS